MLRDYPLVRIEREWLEFIDGLHKKGDLWRELVVTAIGKAIGEDVWQNVNGFVNEECQKYWLLTEIIVADRENHRPGLIRLSKEARNGKERKNR